MNGRWITAPITAYEVLLRPRSSANDVGDPVDRYPFTITLGGRTIFPPSPEDDPHGVVRYGYGWMESPEEARAEALKLIEEDMKLRSWFVPDEVIPA